jgi:small subunit ribosomal protein S17
VWFEMAKKVLNGIVVSDKMDKTVVVSITNTYVHPKYKKIIKSKRKYVVHDPSNKFKEGDNVNFTYSRPISATKHWIVVDN